jgi:hypothetical protein
MNVSIITMTRTYNYGATLQAYALQEYVERLGNKCEIIDHMRVSEEEHRTIKLNGFTVGNLLQLPYKRKLETGFSNFENFYRDYMHMGRKYANDEELFENPPEYDVYITGSDQVWNPRYIKEKFYLGFAPTHAKRISYAASLGVTDIPEENQEIIKTYLEKMDAISVRESAGKMAIEKLTNKKVNLNCDPIFLLDKEDWRNIESPVDGVPEDYVLCYMIYKPDWINDWLKEVKKRTGKKIVFVGLTGYRPVYCDKFIRSAGPREFLWLIDHASTVATSSFHGTAFSIMFGKPVIAMPDPPRPARIHNLLEMFGLSNQEIYESRVDERLFETYNYGLFKKTISREQEKTRRYFDQVFRG